MANMGWDLPPGCYGIPDPEDGMSDLVMDILGILEDADTPTELNDQIVKLIEDWERSRDTDREVALHMGWTFDPLFNYWLNSVGVTVAVLPTFSRDPNHAQTVVRYFDEGTFSDDRSDDFRSRYRPDMTPLEICNLAIAVLTKDSP